MLLALSLLLAQAPDAGAFEPPTPAAELVARTSAGESVEQLLDDGRYVRFGTEKAGPVHTWRPRSYRADTAVTVVYVHGFFTSSDQALREHRLVTQFRDSGRNALFIVPEARSGRSDPVYWPDLEPLLAAVEQRLALKRPQGPVVLVGHSGAYRTLAGWLTHPKVERVLLVDGLYGNEQEFQRWLDASATHQLVLIGFDTQQRTEWLLKKRPQSLRLDTLPWLYDELPPALRKAPLLNVQSERLDHMQLVTDGRLLPWLLHTFR